MVGCGSDGSAPQSIDGTWCFLVVAGQCADAPPGILNQRGTGGQTIQVGQIGNQVSAQFDDLAGARCSLSGTYAPDQFLGALTISGKDRVIEAYIEGFARVHNGRRQVDGWLRITVDSEEQCVGEVIEFCAILEDDVRPAGPPEFAFIEPANKTNVVTGNSVSVLYVDDWEGGVATTTFYADRDGDLKTTDDQILIASRSEDNGRTQSFTWNTTGAPLGAYRIIAVTTGGGATLTNTANGLVCILCDIPAELLFAKQAGGENDEDAARVASFPDGSSVVCGSFRGDITLGAGESNQASFSAIEADDAFVARYNADGTLAWARHIGGTVGGSGADADDMATGIGAFPDGSCVVGGRATGEITFSRNESDAFSFTVAVEDEAWLARYNADGSLAWVRHTQTSNGAEGWGAASFADGSSILVGRWIGVVTFNAGGTDQQQLTSSDAYDAFVARYNADGSLAWVAHVGDIGRDRPLDASTFPDGSCVVCGMYTDTVRAGRGEANDTTLGNQGSILTGNGSGRDIWVARFNADGTLAWLRGAGSTTDDEPRGVAAIPNGLAVVTGYFTGTATFGAQTLPGVNFGLFLACYEPDGTVGWVRSANDAFGADVAAFPDGTVMVTGGVEGLATFGAGEPTEVTFAANAEDFLIAQYDLGGNLLWACSEGGANDQGGNGIATFPDGAFIVAGGFRDSGTFGPGNPNETTLNAIEDNDAFLAKYMGVQLGPVIQPPPPPPPPPTGPMVLIAWDRDGVLYTVDPSDAGLTRITQVQDSGVGSNPIGVVSSSIWVPQRNQIWIGTGGSSARTMFPGSLFTMDLIQGSGFTFISGTADFLFDNRNEVSGHAGLALRPSDGAIFGMVGDSGAIVSIDTTTGQASDCTQLGVGQEGNGITFVGDTLYWATNNSIYTISNLDSTPQANFVGNNALVGFPQTISDYSIGSLTTTPKGLLSGFDPTILGILKVDGGGGSQSFAPTYLVAVEASRLVGTQSIRVSHIGLTALFQNIDPSPVRVDGLAWVPTFSFD